MGRTWAGQLKCADCGGPIRHSAVRPVDAPHDVEVAARQRFDRIHLPADTGIQYVFRFLANDTARTEKVIFSTL